MNTPSHMDFGREVEHILNMYNGVLLLVDSVQGLKQQTCFVLEKVFRKGMKVLLMAWNITLHMNYINIFNYIK